MLGPDMTTFTKIIQSMNCEKQVQSLTDVVYQINWTLAGTADNGAICSRVMLTNVPSPESNFTPYDQLTESQVMLWIDQYTSQAELNDAMAEIEAELQMIANTITPALPWV